MDDLEIGSGVDSLETGSGVDDDESSSGVGDLEIGSDVEGLNGRGSENRSGLGLSGFGRTTGVVVRTSGIDVANGFMSPPEGA